MGIAQSASEGGDLKNTVFHFFENHETITTIHSVRDKVSRTGIKKIIIKIKQLINRGGTICPPPFAKSRRVL